MPSVTFTSSGSWTALASTVDCQCWGEGDNGTGGLHNSHAGNGGGAGAYGEETSLALTVSSNYPFTIGSGGTSTATSFPGDSVTVAANPGNGTVGGAAGSNTIAFAGGGGGNGSTGTGNRGGGAGGGSAGASGAGGRGGNGTTTVGGTGGTAGTGSPGGAAGGNGGNPTTSGSAGSAPGGGGGGGGSTSTINGALGDGAAGQITIIYSGAITGTAALAGAGTLTAQGGPAGTAALSGIGTMTAMRAGAGVAALAGAGTLTAHATLGTKATLAGTGTLTAFGSGPQPAVVNQWSASYGQGTTFTSVTSSLQSCVTPLTPALSVGGGSGVPAPGNWLFAISSWTQDPAIANVHVGTGDDIHSYWREYPAAGPGGLTRTAIAYTPNIARTVGNVYVAPDGEIAAINVLVVEVAGLGPWDTVVGTQVAYDAASTSISLSHAAGAAATFFIGATGGDNVSSGQAFLPSGWMGLATQTQTNGVNALADNILTAAYLPSTNSTQSVSGSASVAENLSGFMLAVLTFGTSPIPAGHNPNWPYLITEAGFGSGYNTPDSEITWTDVTSRLWSWDETTGIQFQLGQLQSTDLTMEWDNFDAAFISTNTASPYYPNVQPGTPIRIRAALGTLGGVVTNRWYILQRNAEQWGEEIDEAYRRFSPVTGSDLWASLSAVPPTFYRAEIYSDSPYAWWPLDDQPGTAGVLPTALLNAAPGNTNTLNVALSPNGAIAQDVYTENGNDGVVGSPTSALLIPPSVATYTTGADPGWMFGDPPSAPSSVSAAGNPVESAPGSAAWQTAGQSGTTGSYGWFLNCHDTSFPALSGGITIECWFNYAFYGTAQGMQYTISPGAGYTPFTGQPYNTPLTIWEIATGSNPVCVLQLDTSGHLNLITYNGSTGTSHSIYSSSDLRSASWHMVTVTLTTTTWQVWLDGGQNATVSGTATGMTSAWAYLIANGDFGSAGGGSPGSLVHGGNVSLSHIAVYPVQLPYYRVLDHYWAAVTAYGQMPAPTAVQVTWVSIPARGTSGLNSIGDYFAPDGTSPGSGYNSTRGVSMSAVVVATAGSVTSGPSAWTTGATTNYALSGVDNTQVTGGTSTPWAGWTGLAPSFNLYTSQNVGNETEAAVVNGSGDSFGSGYGGSASGGGVCQVSGGSGASPPASASSVGDTAGQRIERLMNAGNFTSPNRCIDPAPLLVQAPGGSGGGTQAGAAIQAIQQSDSGMLFVDNCDHLTYWQRPHLASQYTSPVWQLGPSSGEIPYYREIRWITDPQRVWNAITVTPLSPTGAALPEITPTNASAVAASQDRYGAQPLPVTSWLQSQSEQQAQANWLFSNFGTPQRRAENVKIEAAAYPAAWILIMGVNVGDVVTLEDWGIGGGGTVHTYRVTELKRELSFGTHGSAVTGNVVLTCDYEPTSYWS